MNKKIGFLLLALALIAAFFVLDLGHTLRFETLKSRQQQLLLWYDTHPWQFIGLFMLVYITATALSFPGATVLTLAGGAVFGLGFGTLLVSFASSIGATLAFLAARWLARDGVQRRFGAQMQTLNQGVEKEGGFYLFTLRLVPLIPFFAINLMMGLTPMKTWTFYWVSQVGMLAGTLVYVNAGTQLGQLESPAGILSAPLLASFVLLGLFPWVAKKLVTFVKARKTLKGSV
jgi:uncharacterized membrane protein YdjX (TVP38/TMEM64 family)